MNTASAPRPTHAQTITGQYAEIDETLAVVLDLFQGRTRSYLQRTIEVILKDEISSYDLMERYEELGYHYRVVDGSETVVLHRHDPELSAIMFHFVDGLSAGKQRGHVTMSVWGNVAGIKQELETFAAFGTERNPSSMATWVFKGNHGLNQVTVPLAKPPVLHDEFYPYLGDVNAFIDAFAASDSNILILNGDPGLGKSTFIKHLLQRTGWQAVVCYDPSVIKEDDQLYTDFLEDTKDVMILEDADTLLESRLDGNDSLSKILNIADGILSSSGKKYVFTANLRRASDIDPALVRPGRCFSVVQFRPLERSEAERAAAAAGVELTLIKNEYTVAEIYAGKNGNDAFSGFGRMGFGRDTQ